MSGIQLGSFSLELLPLSLFFQNPPHPRFFLKPPAALVERPECLQTADYTPAAGHHANRMRICLLSNRAEGLLLDHLRCQSGSHRVIQIILRKYPCRKWDSASLQPPVYWYPASPASDNKYFRFSLYRLRRRVEDIYEFLRGILADGLGELERQKSLAHLRRECEALAWMEKRG